MEGLPTVHDLIGHNVWRAALREAYGDKVACTERQRRREDREYWAFAEDSIGCTVNWLVEKFKQKSVLLYKMTVYEGPATVESLEVWRQKLAAAQHDFLTFHRHYTVNRIVPFVAETLCQAIGRVDAKLVLLVETKIAALGAEQKSRQERLDRYRRTRRMLPGREAAGRADPDACCICLDDDNGGAEMMQLPCCGKWMHTGCGEAWILEHGTCPYCRAEQ
jgi:hypothetical protein